jgi:hypothetical protein
MIIGGCIGFVALVLGIVYLILRTTKEEKFTDEEE